MELNDKDIDWLKEAPTLASIGRDIPFTVPSGYFESLSDHLRALALAESLSSDKQEEFSVPLNYFEELPARIQNRIALENINTLVSSDGFTVPENYFSKLSERINSRLDQNKSENKPVRSLFSSWISYGAAASITMLIGSVIYFNSSYYSFNKQLSGVPDQEIINYLQLHSTVSDNQFIIENLNPDGLQQITTDVSSEEIEQYINNTTL